MHWERNPSCSAISDRTPAAFLDPAANNRLSLVFSRDLGDRSRLYQTTFDGTSWSTPADVSSGPLAAGASPRFRDEAPSAVIFGGDLWLFWSSNRSGAFRVYARRRTVTWRA